MRGRAALRLPLARGGNPCACRICELASSESRAPHCDCVFSGPFAISKRVRPTRSSRHRVLQPGAVHPERIIVAPYPSNEDRLDAADRAENYCFI
nr:hypothetical protein DO63_3390 [Burkholderia pseudomallei]